MNGKNEFQLIAENSTDLIYTTDLNQRITYASPSIEKILGYTPDEVLNIHAGKLLTEASYQDQLKAFNKILNAPDSQQKASETKVLELICKDGSTIWGEVHARLLLDESGEPYGVLGICRDITIRKEIEKKLRGSEEKFRKIFHGTSDAIYIFTTDGKILEVNNVACNKLGFSRWEFLRMEKFGWIDEKQKEVLSAKINDLYYKENLILNLTHIRRTGEQIPVELNLSLIDYNGYKAVLASSRNIQQKLDAERREEEHRKNLLWLSRAALDFLEMSELEEIYQYIGKNLSRLIPQSVNIISDINEKEDVITPKYIIGLNNNIYKKIMSLLGVNPIGKSYQFVDDLKKIYRKQNLVAFEGGLKEFSYGYVNEGITRKIEQLLNLKKIYTIGLQRNQKLFSAIHIFKFKTEAITHFNTVEAFLNQASIALQRKMLENELLKAKEKTEESEKLKTAFLANLSHEIRTPLNIILGYVQMLNNPNLAEEFRKQYIDAIHSSSDHLIEIINDVLSMAKLDTGQQNLQTTKFNLNNALLEIYSSFEAKAARKKIRFDCYTPLKDDECIICSDENKIRQVISNLLNNALKFTPEKGMVSFGYSIKKNRVNLFVKDNGIGIPENYLEKIFERFTQVEDSNNRSFEGTGLGLPISRGLVELLGGTIQVKSNLRKGTTFFVNLPLDCSNPEKPSDIKSV